MKKSVVKTSKEIDLAKPLHILGFAPLALNVLMELAEQSIGFQSFKVLENIPAATMEDYVPIEGYGVEFKNFHDQNHIIDTDNYFALGLLGIKSKQIVYKFFKEKIGMSDDSFPNLIHPTAVVSKTAKLNYGIQVGVHTSISVLNTIGFGVNVKNNCYIGHHGKIGDFVTINPGVTISGKVEIGNNSIIGAGAIIRDHVKIGSNCVIGMGSNVVTDIPDNSIAFGNPCKIRGENK